MKHRSMLIFSIGPVQSFIAAARKIEDLWSGSYLLSHLTRQAIVAIYQEARKRAVSLDMIYPAVDPAALMAGAGNSEAASMPNRFFCIMDTDQDVVAELAQIGEAQIRRELLHIGHYAIKTVFPPDADIRYMESLLEKQADSLLEIFWATSDFDEDSTYAETRSNLEKRLAAVKNQRPYCLNPQHGLVCTVCGEQQAMTVLPLESPESNYYLMKENLFRTWSSRVDAFSTPVDVEETDRAGRIKDGESLCGICLIKRLTRDYFRSQRQDRTTFASFPSTLEFAGASKYFAILVMDGDDMGRLFAMKQGRNPEYGDSDLKYHQELSRRLADYSRTTVPELVSKYEGKMVYSGGDDVMALVPVKNALRLASDLRWAFSDPQTGLDHNVSSSAGLVIGHAKAPLQMLLQQARRMESQAKNYSYSGYNKNALGLSLVAHSGEIREVVLPWAWPGGEPMLHEQPGPVDCFKEILRVFKESLSFTFADHFGQAFLPLLGADIKEQKKLNVIKDDKEKNRDLLTSETARLLKRSQMEGGKPIESRYYAEILMDLHEALPSTLQFLHLLEMARFLKRKEALV